MRMEKKFPKLIQATHRAKRWENVPLPCKPDSVHPAGAGLDGHFSHPAGAERPACAECDYYPGFLTGGPPFPCSVLHHARFAVPSGCPDSRWALTPPFHPCLCPCGPSAVSFCCTVCPGSSRFPSLTFMRRVALWCPDFPHPPLARKLRPSGERQGQGAPLRLSFQGKDHSRICANSWPISRKIRTSFKTGCGAPWAVSGHVQTATAQPT